MIVKEVSMTNFRSVYGSLSMKLDNGIIELYGDNGSGKTTIAKAIEFALFGLYPKYEQDEIINDVHRREVTGTGESPEASVTLRMEHLGEDFIIERDISWDKDIQGNDDKNQSLWINHEQYSINRGTTFIAEKLFPSEEWRFCLLDGEYLTSKITDKKTMEKSIKALLKLPFLGKLHKHAKAVAGYFEGQVDWFKGRKEELEKERDGLAGNIKELDKIKSDQWEKIRGYELEKEGLENELKDRLKKLPSFTKIQEEIDNQKNRYDSLQKQAEEKKQLCRELEGMMPYALIAPLIKKKMELLYKIQTTSKGDIVNFYRWFGGLEGALNKLMDYKNKIMPKYKNRVSSDIKKLTEEIDKTLSEFSDRKIPGSEELGNLLENMKIASFIDDISKKAENITASYDSLREEIRGLENKRKGIKKYLGDLTKEIEDIRKKGETSAEQIGKKQDAIVELTKKITVLEKDVDEYEKEIKEKNKVKEEIIEKLKTGGVKGRYIICYELADKLHRVLGELYKKNEAEKIKKINEHMAKLFREAVHKKSVFKGLILEKNYELLIKLHGGESINFSTRPSKGETSLAALCFLLAINKEVGNETLVLDDVWGHLDDRHINNLGNLLNKEGFTQVLSEGIKRVDALEANQRFEMFFDEKEQTTKFKVVT